MFRVKALYDYGSPHDDDLSFPAGQIITVTEEEDADWYVGEYKDETTGEKREGLFPRNFVEKYEPEPPPRPNRASRIKPTEAPSANPPPASTSVAEEVIPAETERVTSPVLSPVPTPKLAQEESPQIALAANPPAPTDDTKPAHKSAPVSKAPPPVASKPSSSSFKDRIAAFNKPAAAPVAPFKPGGGATGFIKKPFVAPPPSRNAYVPPPPRETTHQKVYRREEDPEIAERQAEDLEAAERAGLASTSQDSEDADTPKPTSLKERIALLQKQQMEQAQRAEAAQREKAKRPSKKRTESEIRETGQEDDQDAEQVSTAEDLPRGSSDAPRGLPPRRISHGPGVPVPNRELLSDTNDADQSAAGETTEEADGASTSVEDEEDKPRRSLSTRPDDRSEASAREERHQGQVPDPVEEEEEEEEDEVDAETRRKLELRNRMAKMSGGMGMAGMFGPPGGLPMGNPPPKKKSSHTSEVIGEDPNRPPPQRMPMVPVPGMSVVHSPESEDTQLGVEHEEETKITASRRAPEVVPDVEDAEPMSPPTGRAAPPPVPSQRPGSTSERPVPAPPADRPVPPRPAAIMSPSPGSESDDEMPPAEESHSRAVPPVPGASKQAEHRAPPIPQRTPNMGSETFSSSATSPTDKRSSRVPPPIPFSSPPMSPPIQARPPPPPPPSAAPPAQAIGTDKSDEETEYEGDYDTDIASGATHKDALKSHARQASADDSATADDSLVQSPHIPAVAPPPIPPSARAAPPPPPPQQPPPSRQSMDAPRNVPPPVPQVRQAAVEEDEDYDPYHYSGVPPTNSPRPNVPPPPPSQPAPPPQPPAIFVPQDDPGSDGDDLYTSPPPPVRQSIDRPAPPPPPPPHQTLQHGYVPPPIPQNEPPPQAPSARKSLDVSRSGSTFGRKSTDLPRPSSDQAFIANDVDLGASSGWWTQPNTPPPAFQARKDVLYEIEESTTSKRGGKTTVSRDVYVLFQDYSQTIVTARFDPQDPSDVFLEQRHEAPPARLRQDQLEDAHSQFGQRLTDQVAAKQNTVVGDGSSHGLVIELLKSLQGVLQPVGSRAYGALVYANLANATVQQYDEIRPGDIITFRNAKFEGKHGAMHQKYKTDLGKEHVGIVVEWDGTKKKVRAWEQGRESKKCKVESFRVGDLRSGEVRVWRLMSRSWVGWDDGK